MRYFLATVAIVLLLIVLIFSIQNRDAMDVSFLVWSMSMPKVFLILGTYVLGMFSGWGVVELLRAVF